ncbi:hypothetical protein D3C80_1309680 [compost metagenome]
MMECHKEVKVWNVGAITSPSLEMMQFQHQAAQDAMKALAEATQIFVLPEEPGLSQFAEERAEQAMRDPERSIVVGRPTTPERSRLLTRVVDSGAVVVASLEDAALYVACAV